MQLQGRTALITGAGQNIGLAIAKRLHAAGATVILVDHQETTLQAAAEQLGSRVYTVCADLRNAQACRIAFSQAEGLGGQIDIVVNNAYKGYYQSLEHLSDEAWTEELSIGLTAMMVLCKAALPGMRARGHGVFLNLGSINSFTPGYGMAAYATVKGGIVNFTRQIAVEYGPAGIRANCLCPGFITNPQREAQFAAKPLERRRVEATIPLRRVGTNDDLTDAALFLVSESSRFLTGQCLVIDGGASVQNSKLVTWPFQEALAELP